MDGTRVLKLRDLAINEALKSSCKFKHGALIIKGNKVICSAHNNSRTSFLGKMDYQQHAEMAVVTKFFNHYIRRDNVILRNLHRYKIFVVRIPNDYCKQNNRVTVLSAPCMTCIKRLKQLGFKKILYSNDCNKIEEIDIQNNCSFIHYTSTHNRKVQLFNSDIFTRQKMDI